MSMLNELVFFFDLRKRKQINLRIVFNRPIFRELPLLIKRSSSNFTLNIARI